MSKPMASFEPATGYANDWQFRDSVISGTLRFRSQQGDAEPPTHLVKVVRPDVMNPDWQIVAAGLLVSATTVVWEVWPVVASTPAPAVELNPVLTINGADWIVQSCHEFRWGPHWGVGASLALENTNG